MAALAVLANHDLLKLIAEHVYLLDLKTLRELAPAITNATRKFLDYKFLQNLVKRGLIQKFTLDNLPLERLNQFLRESGSILTGSVFIELLLGKDIFVAHDADIFSPLSQFNLFDRIKAEFSQGFQPCNSKGGNILRTLLGEVTRNEEVYTNLPENYIINVQTLVSYAKRKEGKEENEEEGKENEEEGKEEEEEEKDERKEGKEKERGERKDRREKLIMQVITFAAFRYYDIESSVNYEKMAQQRARLEAWATHGFSEKTGKEEIRKLRRARRRARRLAKREIREADVLQEQEDKAGQISDQKEKAEIKKAHAEVIQTDKPPRWFPQIAKDKENSPEGVLSFSEMCNRVYRPQTIFWMKLALEDYIQKYFDFSVTTSTWDGLTLNLRNVPHIMRFQLQINPGWRQNVVKFGEEITARHIERIEKYRARGFVNLVDKDGNSLREGERLLHYYSPSRRPLLKEAKEAAQYCWAHHECDLETMEAHTFWADSNGSDVNSDVEINKEKNEIDYMFWEDSLKDEEEDEEEKKGKGWREGKRKREEEKKKEKKDERKG